MNCQDFESIIIETARDRLIDALARERALDHIKRCAACANLMVEERALSRDLRGLSARRGADQIPSRIETALLTAFRENGAARAAAPSSDLKRRVKRINWPLAAAAVAALAFGISLAVWIASSQKREFSVNNGNRTAPANTPSQNPGAIDKTPPQTVITPVPAVVTKDKRQRRFPRANPGRRAASSDTPQEFVTQFFPVMQGNELIPLESGQIVRVRMPRSNLISLGIPLNQERANETIQADVLVSNEGLARAIRFVY